MQLTLAKASKKCEKGRKRWSNKCWEIWGDYTDTFFSCDNSSLHIPLSHDTRTRTNTTRMYMIHDHTHFSTFIMRWFRRVIAIAAKSVKMIYRKWFPRCCSEISQIWTSVLALYEQLELKRSYMRWEYILQAFVLNEWSMCFMRAQSKQILQSWLVTQRAMHEMQSCYKMYIKRLKLQPC